MHKDVIYKIVKTECNGRYCPLKELLLFTLDDRTGMQFALLEIHKYVLSRGEEKDVGREAAIDDWIANGWAELFAKMWQNGQVLEPHQFYDAMLIQQLNKGGQNEANNC